MEYRQREKLENYVVYTIFFTADGRAFFPGWCRDRFYGELKAQFGDSFEDTMQAMVGMTGDELTSFVNPAR